MTNHGSGRRRSLVPVVALVGLFALGPASPAAEAVKGEASSVASLKWIPADAAFYGAMLRSGEQVRMIARSNAWARLTSLPAVQMLWQKVQAEWSEEGQMAPLYKLYQQPENQQLVALLGDMFAHEVFLYGGDDWPQFTTVMQDVVGAARFGPLFAMLTGQGRNMDQTGLRVRLVLDTLKEHAKDLKVPTLVIGFKLSKKERAQAQIKRLENLLKQSEFRKHVTREKVAGGNFLTLKVDGSMVPWDQIPWKTIEETEGEYDALVKRLKTLKLTVSLGLRDDFLLLSVGESNAHLARLGHGERLADRPELAPLKKILDKKLTSVGYASKAMQARLVWSKKDVHDYIDTCENLLKLVNLTDAQRAQIHKDLVDLGKDINPFLPTAGAVVSYSYLTDRGWESFTHDASTYPDRDGSKPLTLLHHVGGNPLLATVSRSKNALAQYRVLAKWVRVAYRYFEEYGEPLMEENVRAQYKEFAKAFLPLARQLNRITEKSFLPALADGQAGFVLDAKLTSRHWHKALPAADKPLPLPEPAIILGVSDAAQLREAMGEYRSVTNQILAKLHEMIPSVPELKIPKPDTRKVKGGTLYSYPLPERWGLDPRIVPNGGLGERVAVLGLTREGSERLLADTPLKATRGPLADVRRPLASATYVNGERMVDALVPWVDWGLRAVFTIRQVRGGGVPEQPQIDPNVEAVMKQVHDGLEVLKVFRSYASVTYREGGVWVTHAETVIRDLPAK